MCMHNRIKEIRKALNINQIDFAKQIGLSQSTLAMIEVGKRNFSDKHIKLICSTFNISEHWIRTGEKADSGSGGFCPNPKVTAGTTAKHRIYCAALRL